MRLITHCHRDLTIAILTVATAMGGQLALAAPASDVLLPASTKGYVSVPKPEEAKARFDETQLGQLVNDASMQPFIDSAREQMKGKFGMVTERLGVTWDDLDGVASGELSLALIERPGQDAALAITIGVAGRAAEAEGLLAAVERQFATRRARKQTATVAGTELTIYRVPAADDKTEPFEAVYFIRDDLLCGINGRAQAEAMLKRFDGSPSDNLRSVVAYQEAMNRCRQAAGRAAPDMKWFIDPFGYIWASRTISKLTLSRYDKDMPKILADQGFNAARGVGGYVQMVAPGHVDWLVRAAVYAPPVKGKESDPLRWNLAMRMMQMPNTRNLVPQSWVPRMSARYSTYSIDLLNAYDHVGTLVDAVRGHEGVFQTSMDGIEKDTYGAQVNIRDEFIAHLGKRVTLVTDYSTPISVASERSVCAIEAADEAKLAATLAKLMAKEPDYERREFEQYVIWEQVTEAMAYSETEIDAPGFGPLHTEDEFAVEEEQDTDKVLPNSVHCVALGQYFMASDIDFLKELLNGFGRREMLISSGDFQHSVAALERLAPGAKSGMTFARTDEAYRPTYELIRRGKMPESETILGKLLNKMLTTEIEKEEGVLRKQRVDGRELPNFEQVRRYFGPAATAIRSDRDGWMITATILNKEAP